MRLLNSVTLEFGEFIERDIPPYAILSHVWSSEEVSYEEFLHKKIGEGHGYQKISQLCKLARSIGYVNVTMFGGLWSPLGWVWIDTICIDKRSSAELSEAINSMFHWYKQAAVCYVFLPDVKPLSPVPEINETNFSFNEEEFLQSKWFTRGWTLQELIAPSHCMFYNTCFEVIGEKAWEVKGFANAVFNLIPLIVKATSISITVLEDPWYLHTFCVAERMSWASKRVTSRPEDIAYCLLGMFNVNMPLLYGEGAAKAFLRLQTEIISNSMDDSIFAWRTPSGSRPSCLSGLLTRSPKYFEGFKGGFDVGHKVQSIRGSIIPRATYDITPRGIELSWSMPQRYLSTSMAGVTCIVYPLFCTKQRVLLQDGRYSGVQFLKIWARPDQSPFHDHAVQAYRSGIFFAPYSDMDKVMHQAAGYEEPSLLELNPEEIRLYKNMQQDTDLVHQEPSNNMVPIKLYFPIGNGKMHHRWAF